VLLEFPGRTALIRWQEESGSSTVSVVGRFKRILTKIVYPYGKQTGGLDLLKKDLKGAPRGIARAIIAPGSDLFETDKDRRLREFRNMVGRGYKIENAYRIAGLKPGDLDDY
jgi:hypothetical protein